MRRRTAGIAICTVTIKTEAYASVSVNGITIEADYVGYAVFKLRKGSYAYSVNKEGYYDASGRVSVTGNMVLDVTLTAKPSTLGLVIHLPLSENADDISGNNRVVDARNVTYRNGRAYLDGNNSYIDTRYVISLPVTICFKCKLADVTSKQGNHFIITAMRTPFINDWPNHTNMLLINDSHSLTIYSYGGYYSYKIDTTLEQDECEVVVVFTPSYSKCYLNGTLLLNAKGNSSAANGTLVIGDIKFTTSFTTEMTVRDFKIYERELSEQDIINGNY